MIEPVVVAVDLSSSGVRCTAHRADLGVVADVATALASTTRADGTSTHRWDDVLTAALDGLRALGGRVPGITAVVLSGTASNFTVTAPGVPPREVVLWSDTRAHRHQAAAVAAACELDTFPRTLCPAHVSYWPARLRWAVEGVGPDVGGTVRFAGIKDLVVEHLTGRFATDPMTAAATGVYDSAAGRWDAPSLHAVGLRESQFPAVRPAVTRWPMLPEVARRLGLPSGIPVVLGGMDGPLAQLGCAGMATDIASCTIGTTLAFRMGSRTRVVDPDRRVWCYPVLDDLWVAGGAGSNGGNVLTWLTGLTGDTAVGDLIARALDRPAPDGLVFLPYLHGERAPLWRDDLRGGMVGLAAHHDAADLARAALDGVAGAAIDLAAAVRSVVGDPVETRFSGGFLAQAEWTQLVTDALGTPTAVPVPEIATGVGAAMLGWSALGAHHRPPTPAADRRREPRPAEHHRLTAGAARMRRVRDALDRALRDG